MHRHAGHHIVTYPLGGDTKLSTDRLVTALWSFPLASFHMQISHIVQTTNFSNSSLAAFSIEFYFPLRAHWLRVAKSGACLAILARQPCPIKPSPSHSRTTTITSSIMGPSGSSAIHLKRRVCLVRRTGPGEDVALEPSLQPREVGA